MRVAAIQFPVTMDVAQNLGHLEAAVSSLPPGTLAVAPEGALSGYEPRPGLPGRLDDATTLAALEAAQALVARTGVNLVVGACLRAGGLWRNSSFHLDPSGGRLRYDKINLAQSEQGDFAPGDDLPVFDVAVATQPLRLGVQMCREIRYPEQWRVLAGRGAQVVAYVNNAAGSSHGAAVWRAHVVSRAAETQRFVIGANTAAPDQTCPSLIVAPTGAVLAEAPLDGAATIQAEIDLSQVSDWVLDQARSDVVRVEAVERRPGS